MFSTLLGVNSESHLLRHLVIRYLKVSEEAPDGLPESLRHFPPPPATCELGESFDFLRGATQPPLWATWLRILIPSPLWPTSVDARAGASGRARAPGQAKERQL